MGELDQNIIPDLHRFQQATILSIYGIINFISSIGTIIGTIYLEYSLIKRFMIMTAVLIHFTPIIIPKPSTSKSASKFEKYFVLIAITLGGSQLPLYQIAILYPIIILFMIYLARSVNHKKLMIVLITFCFFCLN